MDAMNGPVLRDIHLPPEPSWWPPAPGWWVLAGIMLMMAWLGWRWLRRRQRVARARRVLRLEFDRASRLTGAEGVAAMSELLRRAAMRHAPHAARLRDEEWLAFLDGDDPAQPFQRGPGRLLLDGPYRAQVGSAEAADVARVVGARLDGFVNRADV